MCVRVCVCPCVCIFLTRTLDSLSDEPPHEVGAVLAPVGPPEGVDLVSGGNGTQNAHTKKVTQRLIPIENIQQNT